jgi:hypothetical protein
MVLHGGGAQLQRAKRPKHVKELYASERFAHFPLEREMTKSPRILTRRSIFRAGAVLAVAATTTPLFSRASARAEDARQPGAEPVNGDGFYRFKIGDFKATVISDGHGPVQVWPVLVMNASDAEVAPVLKANFMQPVIQITTNMLVVDTGRERILVDNGFGEKLGPTFGSFPALDANLQRAGITPESIDLVVTSHGHLDHIGGLATKSGRAGLSEGSVRFCRYGVELLDRQPLRKRRQQFADARSVQEGHDCRGARELATRGR